MGVLPYDRVPNVAAAVATDETDSAIATDEIRVEVFMVQLSEMTGCD
jgi:hypothetical protein